LTAFRQSEADSRRAAEGSGVKQTNGSKKENGAKNNTETTQKRKKDKSGASMHPTGTNVPPSLTRTVKAQQFRREREDLSLCASPCFLTHSNTKGKEKKWKTKTKKKSSIHAGSREEAVMKLSVARVA